MCIFDMHTCNSDAGSHSSNNSNNINNPLVSISYLEEMQNYNILLLGIWYYKLILDFLVHNNLIVKDLKNITFHIIYLTYL